MQPDCGHPLPRHPGRDEISATLQQQVEAAASPIPALQLGAPVPARRASWSPALRAYKDIAGEECQVFSMGGGTYARTMQAGAWPLGPASRIRRTAMPTT